MAMAEFVARGLVLHDRFITSPLCSKIPPDSTPLLVNYSDYNFEISLVWHFYIFASVLLRGATRWFIDFSDDKCEFLSGLQSLSSFV